MKIKITLLLIICLTFFYSANAQSPDSTKGEAAFLFAYYPKEGKQQQFEEGYKSHLEWHRDNKDPFAWYGWYVSSGSRLGMFIDGTFGISFEAFDKRVKPVEDGANFKETTAPYADAIWRKVFKLKPELSTRPRLEDWSPSSNIEVYRFSVVPGKEIKFEETVSQLVLALNGGNQPKPEFTVYRQLAGGDLPTYLLMVHRKGFAYFASDKAFTTLSHAIKSNFDESTAQRLLKALSQSVKQIHGETWQYRSDLSLFPSEG